MHLWDGIGSFGCNHILTTTTTTAAGGGGGGGGDDNEDDDDDIPKMYITPSHLINSWLIVSQVLTESHELIEN